MWAVGFLFGLPLMSLVGLSTLLLGQIGVIGFADRLGVSPLIGFNALNVALITVCAGFLILVGRQSETFGFTHWWKRFPFPRFGFPNFNFWSWKPSQFGQNTAPNDTAFTARKVKEPVCKILFIHYQPASQNNAAAETLTFDYQNNDEKTYVNTNNFYET